MGKPDDRTPAVDEHTLPENAEASDADADEWAMQLVDSVDPDGARMVRELRAAGVHMMDALVAWQTRRLNCN